MRPCAVVRFGVSCAQRRLIGVAENLAQEPGLHVGPPGDARRRRDVVRVGLVALSALLEQDELGRGAARSAWRQEVAPAVLPAIALARRAADAGHRDRGHDARKGGERRLDVVADAAREGQVRLHPPRILREHAEDPVAALERGRRQFLVLARVALQDRRAGHGGDSAGQHRVGGARRRQLIARRAWEVGGVEQTDRRIEVGVEPQRDPADHRLSRRRGVRDHEVPAGHDRVRAPVPGQRVLDAVGRRLAPARTVGREPVRRGGRRGDGKPAGVGERAGIVARGQARRVAEIRAVRVGRQTAAHFVDDVLRQHGPHGHGDERPRRDEVALVRRAGKPRIGVVQVVGRPLGLDRGPRPAGVGGCS